jgi:hypothetical protein
MLKFLYGIDRKAKRWWLRLFWHFVDISVVNAFILYCHIDSGKAISLKDFRRKVAVGLVGISSFKGSPGVHERDSDSPKLKRFKTSVPKEIRTSESKHLPVYSSSRRSAYCSTKSSLHRSWWMYSTCVGLCLSADRNCFVKYHK